MIQWATLRRRKWVIQNAYYGKGGVDELEFSRPF
jgi:hypothetical protein